MAAKRLLDKPPPADSSSEDEYESDPADNEEEEENRNGVAGADDEEEISGGDEEDDDDTSVKKPTVSKPENTGSGSDAESDDTPPSPSLSGFTIKPIVSKPIDDAADKPKKKSSTRPNKRAAESEAPESETSEKDSKSKKKKKVAPAPAAASVTASNGGGDDEDSRKLSRFARVWSEDDEIAVLKGMTEYKAKKGADPYADMGAFHDFIKKSVNADVSKSQLVDKIRRLKKKYLNNAAKAENDEGPVFSNPHELLSFELSKLIWGNGANKSPYGNHVEDSDSKSNSSKKTPVPSTLGSKSTTTVLALPNKEMSLKKEKKKREQVQANGKVEVKKEVEEEHEEEEEEDEEEEGEEEEEFRDKYPYLNKSLESSSFSSVFKRSLPLVESSKLKKLDKEWRELQLEELGLFGRKTRLIHEQAELVYDALKRFI